MKPYLYFSGAAHAFFMVGLLVVGTLLSKPRMSYYAVDLMSSMPAGGSVPGPTVSPIATPAPPVPRVTVPKVARPAEEELPDQDTIRMLAKLKKKRLAKSPPQQASEDRPETSDNAAAAPNTGRMGMGGANSGAGIVAEAGLTFPYPWYLKAIADRLDKQWHPPQEYAPDTTCQVTFVISRAGEISGSVLSKSSGDSLFDQLAMRSVLYANPLPPLPNGFPDETLKVHMKFVGRRL
jgi:TonB family protein